MPLSDTQAVILNAAAQNDDGNILPLPGSLRGGAASKVIGALLSRGLVAETAIDSMAKADPALNTIWRNDEDGRAILLKITEAGLAAIGIEPDEAEQAGDAASDAAPVSATGADTGATTGAADHHANADDTTPKAPAGAKTPKIRTGTKQATLIATLRAPDGATIAEIVAATGWQAHTVRGAIAGALKKKLGLTVASEKIDGRGRVYRLPAA